MDYLYGKLNGTPSINEIEAQLDKLKESDKDLYTKYSELNSALRNKQDKLIAGDGIKIENNIISCTSQGETYEAGNGLNLDNNTFSIDTDIVATKEELNTKQDIISDLDEIRTGAEKGETALQNITSTDVINALGYTPGTGNSNFSGNYNDLNGKPDLSIYELKSEAFSGNYNDLSNKPTIPTSTSDLTNNSGFITSSDIPVTSVNGQTGDVTLNIPTKTSDLENDSEFITNESLENYVPNTRKIGGEDLSKDINELQDLVYEEIIPLTEGNDYNLLDNYSNDFFTKYNDLFTDDYGTLIYGGGFSGQEIDLANIYLPDNIHYYKGIVFQDATDFPPYIIAYIKEEEANGWYEIEDNGTNWAIKIVDNEPVAADTPTLISYSSELLENENVLLDVLGLEKDSISLEQKFDEVEPPYVITDYTENSGALTSITVKSKETGEPTVLTVSGGSTLYQHNITLKITGNDIITLQIITNNNTNIDQTALSNYLVNNGFTSADNLLTANGYMPNYSNSITGLYYKNNSIRAYYYKIASSSYDYFNIGIASITDTIITL